MLSGIFECFFLLRGAFECCVAAEGNNWLMSGVCVRCRPSEVDVALVVMCRPEIAFLIGPPSFEFIWSRIMFLLGSVSQAISHLWKNGIFFRGKCCPAVFDKCHDQGMCLVFS